jgi:PAS domain S-box-containing protein
MPMPLLVLIFQTISVWALIVFLYSQKSRFTLVPLYSFIAVLTLLAHNIADMGFGITVGKFFFLIGSVSFFTSVFLGILIIYLFEGPRATRIASMVVLLVSLFYFALVALLSLQVDTTKWIPLTYKQLQIYFWSLTAIVIDVFLIPIIWELLGKIKSIPLIIRVFVVVLVTYYVDTLIFVTGSFGTSEVYFSMLSGNLANRFVLAIIMAPVVSFFIKAHGFKEESRDKPTKFWEIFNFRSDLESRLRTMEDLLQEQKKLEIALKSSDERYTLALEGTNAGIWDWNIVKNEIMFSPKFCELLGYKVGELGTTLESFREIVHPDDRAITFETIDTCFRDKKPYNVEYRLRNKDGSYRWYLSGGATKFDASGKPLRMVGSTIDIHEKKLISQSLEDKIIELERFNKLMVDRELKMVELKEELQALKK